MYIALVLTEASRDYLLGKLDKIIPCICHHVTLLPPGKSNKKVEDFYELHKDEHFDIRVTGAGCNSKVYALKVDLLGIPYDNEQPHITLCCYNNGKPKDSNNITEWHKVPTYPITIEGILKKIK